MRAATVKLEGKLLKDVEAAKPAGRSLSAHVRWVLQQDLERRRRRDASAAFRTFIDAHPEEREWLSEWDAADLAAPPTPTRGTET